jgi:signal transduction histidine kinase
VPVQDGQRSTSRPGDLARSILREPFSARPWIELCYLLATSALACAAALALGALGLTGLLLSVVIVGIPILAAALRLARELGRWQRALARVVLGEHVLEPEPLDATPGVAGALRASLADRTAWRAVGYFVAKVPLVAFGAWFAVSLWLLAGLGLVSPVLGRAGTARLTAHIVLFAAGVVLLFAAPWATRLVVHLDRRLMSVMLGPDEATARVRALEASRSRTLDATNETLRRIERDLHDGTQAQLIALAMRLGQAKEKLEDVAADSADPELDGIRRLVDDAHRGAKEAISDMRVLARGIHPPALDFGLDQALSTLASRSPVPTEVTVSVPTRPSPVIEAICYFCAAELLANVAQHADASRSSVRCTASGPRLQLVVRDDGRGGASAGPAGSSSSGLAGLVDRIEAVDGGLSIASPPGGPTIVTVELPVDA